MNNSKWNDRNELAPEIGSRVLIAWANGDEIKEVLLITCFRSWMCVDSRFNYWCYSDTLPEIPPKHDYCREAFDMNRMSMDLNQIDARYVKVGTGSFVVEGIVWRHIWNAAIAAAREHGLENV